MPRAGHNASERANAHLRWAERYNKSGNPEKAISHFGRALKYDSAFGPIVPIVTHGSLGSLGSAVGAAFSGASVVSGSGHSPSSSVGTATIERARAATAQNAPNYADRVKAARGKTAYPTLDPAYKLRFLMRMRLYHVAAVIVGSTRDEEFNESATALGISLPWTSPVTLFRNIMAQTEELSSYVAANMPDDAIRMLDKDPMSGNGLWSVFGAGEYTDGASEKLHAMTDDVSDVFPALRYDKGAVLSPQGNGVFDGCNGIADRCNQLARLYDSYAETTNDADTVMIEALDSARSKTGTSARRELIDWTVQYVGTRGVDMLGVLIAAVADRDDAYILAAIKYLIVHYNARIRSVVETDRSHMYTKHSLLAAVDYMEDLVGLAAKKLTLHGACNIARMMADTHALILASLKMSGDPSRRLLARTWVDLTYGLGCLSGKLTQVDDERIKMLYDEAQSIVDKLSFDRLNSYQIVDSVKRALGDDKKRKEDEERARKKRKEDEERKKGEEAENKSAQMEIQAHHIARKAMGLPLPVSATGSPIMEDVTIAELKLVYKTLDDFKRVYRQKSKELHPDKIGHEGKHLGDLPMVALNAISVLAKSLWIK